MIDKFTDFIIKGIVDIIKNIAYLTLGLTLGLILYIMGRRK